MKNLIYVLMMVIGFSYPVWNAHAETRIKEVCKDKMDKKGQPMKGKDGKVVQECKQIKVHKKLEGTAVPQK